MDQVMPSHSITGGWLKGGEACGVRPRLWLFGRAAEQRVLERLGFLDQFFHLLAVPGLDQYVALVGGEYPSVAEGPFDISVS